MGGTKELVGKDGVIIESDRMWSGKYLSSSIKLDNLPSEEVAEGIHKLLKIKTRPDVKKFDINKVAIKYANIIRGNM